MTYYMRKLPTIYLFILSLQRRNIGDCVHEGAVASEGRLNMSIETKDQSNLTIDIFKYENDCKCKRPIFNVECETLGEECKCTSLNGTTKCGKLECSFVRPNKDHSQCICVEDVPIAVCDICIRYFTSAAPSCAPLELLSKEDHQMRTRIGITLFSCSAILFAFCVYCVYFGLKKCAVKSKQSISLPKGEDEHLNTKETFCV